MFSENYFSIENRNENFLLKNELLTHKECLLKIQEFKKLQYLKVPESQITYFSQYQNGFLLCFLQT